MSAPLHPGPQALGLTAFAALRAEDEPWLADCFVPPTEFPLMVGAPATVIHGDPGSGSTGLRLALERAWQSSPAPDRWLLVLWRFNVPTGGAEELSGSALATWYQDQVFVAVARTLLDFLCQQQGIWNAIPDWARATLATFIHQHVSNPRVYVNARVAEGVLSLDALPVLEEILAAKDSSHFGSAAPPVTVMTELAPALRRLHLRGVRILLDDVEPWWEAYPSQVVEGLKALLSSLALFGNPAFCYTLLLPAKLWPSLSQTSVVVRRRVQSFPLQYQEAQLVSIVERRLALAFGRSEATLADLMAPGEKTGVELLHNWLKGCGGSSPRSWLEAIRPFVAVCLSEQGTVRPLAEADCIKIMRRHPPPLRLDPNTHQVFVGSRRVSGVSEGQFAVLWHLAERAGEFCTRKDLYRVYQTANDSRYAEGDVKESDIAGVLDTVLYRLRALIEPSVPAAPVLLETVKRRGVRLRFPARE